MTARLLHRGPDDEGVWCDAAAGLALGHRRLAVLDLSPAGRQPMTSSCGRYVVSFNGEIYNHLELRRSLEQAGLGQAWRGHSDTEVLLAAIAGLGLDAALRRIRGMFAFALWDAMNCTLHLARDRMGEKPLFYGRFGDTWLFGSELKSLRAHPAWQARVDRVALADFLRYAYVPAPRSIFEGVAKVRAGTYVTLRPLLATEEVTAYWSLRECAASGQGRVFSLSAREATEELERVLSASVDEQSVADVPIGAFLSGGIDSSAVVALMQANRGSLVKTFTVGYSDRRYDEAAEARAIARHLGTDHTEIVVEPKQALEIVPQLPDIYDEPFADSSQIPTTLVAHLARSRVTVALSGDGGDELFGGYNRHFWLNRLWRGIRLVSPTLRRFVAGRMLSRPPADWDRTLGLLLGRRVPRLAGDKVHKLAGLLSACSAGEAYQHLVSQWQDPQRVVEGLPVQGQRVAALLPGIDNLGLVEAMMLYDAETYLCDDVLAKVDRAAMSASLETRIPMLDPRVVEYSWRLPLSLKHREASGKWLLRQVLYRYVPRVLVDRPKMGFGVPIDAWLRGPLRDWAEQLLDERQLREQGYFDASAIGAVWREHQSGRRNLQHQLWPVLMFQSWRERWGV